MRSSILATSATQIVESTENVKRVSATAQRGLKGNTATSQMVHWHVQKTTTVREHAKFAVKPKVYVF